MTYNERIFKKQQITINKAEYDKHHLRHMSALETQREGQSLAKWAEEDLKGTASDLTLSSGQDSNKQKKNRGIPGGRNSKTEQKYVLSKMCLGISIVVLFERSPVIDEDKKAGTGQGVVSQGANTVCTVS